MSIKRRKKIKPNKSLAYYTKHGTRTSDETEDFLQQLAGGPMSLGRALNSIRLSEEISRAEFARLLGIPRQHLNDIEKGRRSVSLEKAAKFARSLEYPESLFVRLTLQSMVDEAGLDMRVEIAS